MEAAKTLMDYGRKKLGKQRLIALIQPDNVDSQKVANKIGMGLEKKIILGEKDVNVYIQQNKI